MWKEFLKAHKGQGYSMKELSNMYGKTKVPKRSAKKPPVFSGLKSPPKEVSIKIIADDNVDEFIRSQGPSFNKKLNECFSEVNTFGEVNLNHSDMIILLHDQNMVGFAFMQREASMKQKGYAMYLHTICIFKEHRNKGLCSPFVKAIIKHYKSFGTIHLDVHHKNEAAIKCYKNAGFKETYLEMEI